MRKLILIIFLPALLLSSGLPADSVIFSNVVGLIVRENIGTGRDITATAQCFDGYPYVAGTLEKGDDKTVVVNLHEFDCVTLVEAVTAINRCVKDQKINYSDYLGLLKRLRYRDGKANGYATRLHYFSEWLDNGVKIGVLDFVRPDSSYDTVRIVSFMSENPKLYAPLREPKFVRDIQKVEKRLSGLKIPLITTERVPDFEKYIKEGDIIAFASAIKGLDYTHTAFAFWKRNDKNEQILHFVHASSKSGRVMVSNETLQEYLKAHRNIIGITVARIK